MVIYPPCFTCSLYDDRTDTCPAFPDGITDDVLRRKSKEGKEKECANGIFYKLKDKVNV